MINKLSRRTFIKNTALIAGAGLIVTDSFNNVNASTSSKIRNENGDFPSLNELGIFDSCVTLGKFTSEISINSANELISIMDRYFIKEALVHDYHALSAYPIEHGNERLMKAIANNSRLHPVWVLEPPVAPGLKPAEKIVNDLLNAGVRAVRLRFNTKALFSWMWDDLLTVLEDHRIPCFLDFGTTTTTLGTLTDHNVDNLQIVVHKHPNLPIILSHVMGGLGIHPAAIYLTYRSQNLYLDVSGLLEYWRTVAYEVSPERILYASGMPFTDPGILVSNVQYALGLDANDKKMICGDNLRKLLGGVR